MSGDWGHVIEGTGDPAPPRLLAVCESCGAEPGPVVFVPNWRHGGRRICRACLAAMDALREQQRQA